MEKIEDRVTIGEAVKEEDWLQMKLNMTCAQAPTEGLGLREGLSRTEECHRELG